ncbi:MAG: tyrosine--tRNA ligase [Phycisphaerales bacterium]|nr:MAG: tyrosine--tRNA ligase [Phycisphaerales bacterium]
MRSVDEQLAILVRGCEHIYSAEELSRRVARSVETKTPLRVKLGMDPTAPDLTLGHTVVLRKLRDFQDCGHKAVLIIGDYTARIGDPSGRSKTRPILSDEEVTRNARTYLDQAGKVLSLSPDKMEIRRNSEWLAPMDFADVIRMAAQTTVARMMERDTFSKRAKAGQEVYAHELFYPMMQARDSVEIGSDVELGGTDQTFNNLLGREFQRNAGQPPQVVMVVPLLIGLDGKEKMSKSLGNYVGVTEGASDMFGKIMSIPDSLMVNYFELLTHVPMQTVREITDPARHNPRDAKIMLAKDIVDQYHGSGAGEVARKEFFRIHGGGQSGLPDDIPDHVVSAAIVTDGYAAAADLVVDCGFASSKSEARRLVSERGVRLDGNTLEDAQAIIEIRSGQIIQRGKRQFKRLVLP